MVFTLIILTAPTESIAAVYRIQLKNFEAAVDNKCQFFCVSDPKGCRIGSGGGTLNALDYLKYTIGCYHSI